MNHEKYLNPSTKMSDPLMKKNGKSDMRRVKPAANKLFGKGSRNI